MDTNVLIIYTRGGEKVGLLENTLNLLSRDNDVFVSVATIAELRSFILQRDYGARRIRNLEELLSQFTILDINTEDILNKYAEIDAFSNDKLKLKKSFFTARNMGKNDLYITATTGVYNLTLVTTDEDFNHLATDYLQLLYIDPSLYRN